MNVLRRATAARAVPTARELSSAGVKPVMSYGLTGAAARLWVRRVGTWLGGLRTKERNARCSGAEGFPKKYRDLCLQVAIRAPSKRRLIGLGLERILLF